MRLRLPTFTLSAFKRISGFLDFSRRVWRGGRKAFAPFVFSGYHVRMTFRIFTNDRGKQKGVFMYSALCPMKADSAAQAEAKAESKYGGGILPYTQPHGPMKAIEWPPVTQPSKDWLAKHT